MTLAQIKAERTTLNARWERCYGTDSEEERAVKARLAELVDLEMEVTPMRRARKVARHCNDSGVS